MESFAAKCNKRNFCKFNDRSPSYKAMPFE